MTMTKKYVVICEDVDPDLERHWYLTTRRVFDEAEAAKYVATIHESRHARMVPLETFIEMLPRNVEVHPGPANKEAPVNEHLWPKHRVTRLPTYVCRICHVPHKGGMQCDGEP